MDSTELFALRKTAKNLTPTLRITTLIDLKAQGLKLVAFNNDTWNQRALAWILIDLCKLFVHVGNLTQAQSDYAELLKLETDDEIIESQQEHLEKLVDPFYEQVKILNNHSKNGDHEDSIKGFNTLLKAGNLSPVHHESYGWAIYRLLKDKAEGYDSNQVRTWLKHYLNLKNERPSMVHSQILNWTMKYAEGDPNLRLMDFLKIWDAKNFSHEDTSEGSIDGNKIPSLFSRLCRRLVTNDQSIDIQYLFDTVKGHLSPWSQGNESFIIDTLREQHFWQLYSTHKENNLGALWQGFTSYANRYSSYGASPWHSEILQLAERFMKESNEGKFLAFFKSWDPTNFRPEDWKESRNDDAVYPPLAQKVLKKACSVALKQATTPGSLDWLIATCSEGIDQLPSDEYLPRNRAQLLRHTGQIKDATAAYRELALTLGDKYYVWKEFADLVDDKNLSIKSGLLAKALTIERNEDFLGEVRLSLAGCLIKLERLSEASLELAAYHDHRTTQGWSIDKQYATLKTLVDGRTREQISRPNYKSLIDTADEYAYTSVPWTKMTLVDRWKDDKGRSRVKLYANKLITTSVLTKRFPELTEADLGSVFEAKLHDRLSKDGTRTIHRPLLLRVTTEEKWSSLPLVYAVIDYVNEDKRSVSAVTQDGQLVYFPIDSLTKESVKGQFVSGRLLVEVKEKKDKLDLGKAWKKVIGPTFIDCVSLLVPQLAPTSEAELTFTEQLILVDSVNASKGLFHFVTKNDIDGIVYFSDTDLRPAPGDHYIARGYPKLNKKKRQTRLQIMHLRSTDAVLEKKIKHLEGELRVINKNGKTFGFVHDTYVPGHLLSSAGFFDESYVSATAVYGDGKWRVVKLNSI